MPWSQHCRGTNGERNARRPIALPVLLDWALDVRRTLALQLGSSWAYGRDDPATAAALHAATARVDTLLARLEREMVDVPVSQAVSR
jgi:hypothetical protein